jgi:hypothetical protein
MTEPAAKSIPRIHQRDVSREPVSVARPRRRLAPSLMGVGLMIGVLGWHYLMPSAPPPTGKAADAPRPVPSR